MDKEKIRPLYKRLCGYLSEVSDDFIKEDVWQRYNQTVDQISIVCEKNYTFHKIIPKALRNGHLSVYGNSFRTTLSGLITELEATYFHDETQNQAYTTGIHISQNQQQVQTLAVQIVLEAQDLVYNRSTEYKEGTTERTFLDKLKESLAGVRNATDLLKNALQIAKDLGLSPDSIFQILFG